MSDLVDLVSELDANAKAEAWSKYREILSRNNAPRKTDARELKGVMDTLGIGAERIRADLAVLELANHLEKDAAADPDLDARISAAGDAMSAYGDETKRIRLEAPTNNRGYTANTVGCNPSSKPC